MVDVTTLTAQPIAGQPLGQHLAARAYDPEATHHGCWYEINNAGTILPTPVAIVQSKGPGDALRFLHAATCLLDDIHSRGSTPTRMIVFIEEAYARHIVGLYAGAVSVLQQSAQLIIYQEALSHGRAFQWIVLRNQPFAADTVSMTQFWIFVNLALGFLAGRGYRWYSPTGAIPVFLEPYHGKTRHHVLPGVQFARIELRLEYMEHGRYLHIPHTPRAARARPPNSVRVLLYLRYQPGEDRNTPWYHLESLRSCQQRLAVPQSSFHGPARPALDIKVTLAGMKNQRDYHTALAGIAPLNMQPTVSHTVLFDWGWNTYCYVDHDYRQQFAALNGNFDVAVGINTSALDLAAAAGCTVLRDKEWKQGEYQGSYYNLFLLSEPTYGIFAFTVEDRRRLFDSYLEWILCTCDSLPRTYVKLTFEKYHGKPLAPREEVIGSRE